MVKEVSEVAAIDELSRFQLDPDERLLNRGDTGRCAEMFANALGHRDCHVLHQDFSHQLEQGVLLVVLDRLVLQFKQPVGSVLFTKRKCKIKPVLDDVFLHERKSLGCGLVIGQVQREPFAADFWHVARKQLFETELHLHSVALSMSSHDVVD